MRTSTNTRQDVTIEVTDIHDGRVGTGPVWNDSPTCPDTTVTLKRNSQALGVFRWGREDAIGSAAFWIRLAADQPTTPDLRQGETLAEEVVACILGGYGVPAEIAAAAYRRLLRCGLIRTSPPPDYDDIAAALCSPLKAGGHAGTVRYRFVRQRGARIAGSLAAMYESRPPVEPLALRAWLEKLPGIGPKTASWIVRNQTGCERVAVIDIHVNRAGCAAGVFNPGWRLPRDYPKFELAFLGYAHVGGVSVRALDVCIWKHARRGGVAMRKILRDRLKAGLHLPHAQER